MGTKKIAPPSKRQLLTAIQRYTGSKILMRDLEEQENLGGQSSDRPWVERDLENETRRLHAIVDAIFPGE